MNTIERRIEALETRLNTQTAVPPRIVVVAVYGGAGQGEPHYAWAKDDCSDLIERESAETLEGFRARAVELVPEGEFLAIYRQAPRLDEWGRDVEITPALIARIQARGSD